MKIRRLTFKNLNSLAGEWSIDFTAPEYESEGIFAITGPTGSGKSTILDAICLALYGQTPRLGKITAAGNEIMSRQTGECFAELLFSTVKGDFLAHWSQRRSRDKADGKLQAPKHEVSEAGEGKVLENMLSKVSKVVEELCGMDFERFTRSSMLAQGSFAKFLESNANERAPILEQITGTGIYSELSILVHERKGAEDAKAKTLKDQLEGTVLLSAEDLEATAEARAKVSEAFGKVKEELTVLQAAANWVVSCNRESKELEQIEEGLAEHARKMEDFAEEAKTLARAKEAKAIESLFVELRRLRGEEKSLRDRIASSANKIAESEKSVNVRLEEKNLSEVALKKAKEAKSAATPKIERASQFQSEISGKGEQLAKAREDLSELLKAIEKEESAIEVLEDKLGKGEKEQAASLVFLEENAKLAGLSEAYSGLSSRLERWQDDSREQKKRKSELSEIEKRIDVLNEAATELEKDKRNAAVEISLKEKAHQAQEKVVAELLGGLTSEELEVKLENVVKQLEVERKIVSLSEERAKLVEGKECPLCGAMEHPFSSGKLAAKAHLSATENEVLQLRNRLKNFSLGERSLSETRMKLEKERAAVGLFEERWKSQSEKISNEQKRRAELVDEVEDAQGRLSEMRSGIAADLTGFGFIDGEFGSSGELLESLRDKRDAWESHREKARQWGEAKSVLEKEVEHQRKILVERNLQKAGVEKTIECFVAEIDRARSGLKEIVGEVSLREYAAGFDEMVDAAEKAAASAVTQWSKADGELRTNRSLKANDEETLEGISEKLGKQNGMFTEGLGNRGFANEAEYLGAGMEDADFDELLERSNALIIGQRDLKTKEGQIQIRLKELREKRVTEKPLEVLKVEIADVNQRADEHARDLGALDEKLRQDAEARGKLAEKRELLAKQQKECARWSSLHRLIGSSDGKKFRNFAQGLTFELMVRHANRQLAKMNERYQLVRSADSPLDLEVIDGYQAGEIRSTKNLSGGESFIVSLALALGLSRMSSEKVRVDSLFLDEGFGTLDEEALDTALSALASLNGEGKLIGLISHVPALKERISTQLTLESGRNGRSVLAGPGVKS
ncbi:AAA family ATPase [Luteolibacter sp. AS25]|uniref:AAA family ATPase n=1 Tax=Luteolibacter sp. AS25 TaxID=3135776 RepID=UPI00398B2B42